jgi:hypothetical protein
VLTKLYIDKVSSFVAGVLGAVFHWKRTHEFIVLGASYRRLVYYYVLGRGGGNHPCYVSTWDI